MPPAIVENLRQPNPHWAGEPGPATPRFRRWVFPRLIQLLQNGLTPGVVLRGPRRVGKTVLIRQVMAQLIAERVAPTRILYVAFDELPPLESLEQSVLDIARWFESRMRTAVFLALALCACQSAPRYAAPSGVPSQLSLKVRANFDSVWQAIVETFAESTTGIETIEKASGFVAAARPIDFAGVSDLSALVDLRVIDGAWASSRVQARPMGASARVRYNVFVVQRPEEQEVRVNTSWTGYVNVEGIASGGALAIYQVPLIGHSTGAFERQLLESIAAKLAQVESKIIETQSFRLSKYEADPRKYGESRDDDGWIKAK